MILALTPSGCLIVPEAPVTEMVTASPTPTTSITPTPSQTPTLLPLPTQVPEVRIIEADQALVFGDYKTALELYGRVLSQSNDDELKAAALYGVGLTHFKSGEVHLAQDTFEQLIETYPDSKQALRAFYLIGQLHVQNEYYEDALEAYNTYLEGQAGVIDSHVYSLIGDIYMKQNNLPAAIDAYQKAYLSTYLGSGEWLALKIATAYDLNDEKEVAISLYQDIFYNTNSTLTKAQMNLLIGRIYYANGQLEQAYERFKDAINNYPEAFDSFTSLLTLINDGQEVDELQRGKINFYREQYDLAIEAFDRYVLQPQADVASALYFKGLSTRAMGLKYAGLNSNERLAANETGGMPQDQEAIALWHQIILEYNQSPYLMDAWEAIINTQATYMNNLDLAALTALDFVASAPNAPKASSILFNAGRYYEIAGNLEEAAETWSRLGNEYPSSDETFQGLFFAGMLYYRLDALDKALLSFNRALVLSMAPLETAGAYLWIGIINNNLGDLDTSRDAWRATINSDPNGYYGLRATEKLNDTQAFKEETAIDLSVNWKTERAIAENWLRTAFILPPETNLESPGALALDPRFIRGWEFWSLGLYNEGRLEFEALRNEKRTDPAETFRLINTFIDIGLYRSAIEASRTILTLAGLNEFSEEVPDYFRHVIYGPWYLAWIESAAERFEIPILLLLSLIHQESRFEGFAESTAGARGLMQIMPETGAQIAREMKWPENFSTADLNIPYVNLTLGSNYLSRQINLFNGDLYAALAAYNGGPGNAIAWKEIAGDDPDLFLGSIRYLETRTYIRKISEIYAQYFALYAIPNP